MAEERRGVIRIDLCGHALDIASSLSRIDAFWQRASARVWEPDTLQFVIDHVHPNTVVLDIGAWIGPITLLAAKRGKQVIAVEPDPAARAQLEDNVDRNCDNVTIVAAAVGAQAGQLTLYAKMILGDSETSAVPGTGVGEITVEMKALREVVAMVPEDAPLFIKMDIEGSEYRLAEELAAVVRERRAALHLSMHPAILARSISAGTPGLGVRLIVLRQTLALVRALRSHARVTLWRKNDVLPQDLQLFSWIMLRKRLKNFTLSIAP